MELIGNKLVAIINVTHKSMDHLIPPSHSPTTPPFPHLLLLKDTNIDQIYFRLIRYTSGGLFNKNIRTHNNTILSSSDEIGSHVKQSAIWIGSFIHFNSKMKIVKNVFKNMGCYC